MTLPLAHSANAAGRAQPLVEHLEAVAERAAEFAASFGGAELARWAGLWHDVGKVHPDFQAYLASPEARRGPDHSSAGAVLAEGRLSLLSFLIAGHHGGLPDLQGLKARLATKRASPAVTEALRLARLALPGLEPAVPLDGALPDRLRRSGRGAAETAALKLDTDLFLRMLFSALVDADFLDTEAHFTPEKGAARSGEPDLGPLWLRLEADHARRVAGASSDLDHLRNEVWDHCVQAASRPPGWFRLTVPTGGGKTLSGLAFALRHALTHGLSRAIVAIPYTSIIEQTASTYREVLSEGVLEHHSAIQAAEPASPVRREDLWPRLAAENWDAPVVVTTTVQLFESLFHHRPARCRKLHRIARSVIVLDEAQTLPERLLEPILSGLSGLVRDYGVTVVLSTATQPALARGPFAEALARATDVVPAPEDLFARLRRVRYELPAAGERWSWERAAAELRTSPQALAILNTKADAAALLAALDDPAALHLSTRMCGAHRRCVLKKVKARLSAGRPCRLVSTQVVEAGVDLDFPLVLRAAGPLDRIVQAAGRCNREGRLGPAGGRVVIFEPAEGGTPSGDYETGTGTARALLAAGCDLHDPAVYTEYFRRLYDRVRLDRPGIEGLRAALDFPAVAEKFRMIPDDGIPAVVDYPTPVAVEGLLAAVRGAREPPRDVLRRLQPHLVNVPGRKVEGLAAAGLLEVVIPGLWRWRGSYDGTLGVVAAGRAPEELVF